MDEPINRFGHGRFGHGRFGHGSFGHGRFDLGLLRLRCFCLAFFQGRTFRPKKFFGGNKKSYLRLKILFELLYTLYVLLFCFA